MKILYIKNTFIFSKDIEQEFISQGYELIYMDCPVENEANIFLARFMVEASQCDFIFSLDFSVFLSLACGALNKKYVSWIISPYCADLFNPVSTNSWNTIFCIDSSLATELEKYGCNSYYLPLAARTIPQRTSFENTHATITMYDDILLKEDLDNDFFKQDICLKDSTIGYLDGALAIAYQTHDKESFTANLPNYVHDDVLSQHLYPANSLQSEEKFLDQEFFNPIITGRERLKLLSAIKLIVPSELPVLYSYATKCSDDSFKKVIVNDPIESLFEHVEEPTIVLSIPDRNYKSAIPPIIWAAISCGFPFICHNQKDFSDLNINNALLYSDTNSFYKIIQSIPNSSANLSELSKSIIAEAELHTFKIRITYLLNIL